MKIGDKKVAISHLNSKWKSKSQSSETNEIGNEMAKMRSPNENNKRGKGERKNTTNKGRLGSEKASQLTLMITTLTAIVTMA